MASSYQIPWAYRAATEPTSVSHDRKETGPANDLTAGVRPGPPGAQEHSHGDGPLLRVVCICYRSHNIIRHGPHTCRRTTRTALDEAWKSIWDTKTSMWKPADSDLWRHNARNGGSLQQQCVWKQSRPMKRLDTSVVKGKCQHNVTGVSGTQFQQCLHFAVIHVVPM